MFFIEYRVIDPLVRDQMLTRISATTFVYFNMIPIDCCTVLQYNQNWCNINEILAMSKFGKFCNSEYYIIHSSVMIGKLDVK